MNSQQFLAQNEQVIKFITNYLEKIKDANILSDVSPFYLSQLLPKELPKTGEDFTQIFQDFHSKIMPGVVHWSHPHFHGYLPSSHAYPSILADMFSAACGAIGFSWMSSPAMTELEVAMTDWLGQALGLPSTFLSRPTESQGGGIMASSASECILLTMIAARRKAIAYLKSQCEDLRVDSDCEYLSKLVAYCSEESHSSVRKAANVAMIALRVLETNEAGELAPEMLRAAIEKDLKQSLMPCFVVITLGTSSSGAFDNLEAIAGIVANVPTPGCWLHVNAAYGGNNFICPELRKPLRGIQLADSICVNPYKGLLINIDSTCLWVQDKVAYCSGLIVNPLYLDHHKSSQFLDLRNWSLWLSRRFRSMKIWFTFRLYGIEGLQKHVRNMLEMAETFAKFVRNDVRFELCNEVSTPLVCFRLIGSDGLNQELLANINSNNKILMTPAMIKSKYALRFVVGHEATTDEIIEEAWNEVVLATDKIYNGVIWDNGLEGAFRRFSYTRRVSFLDYRLAQPRNALKDLDSPILVPHFSGSDDDSSQDSVY